MYSKGSGLSQSILSNRKDCTKILAEIVTGAIHPNRSKIYAIFDKTERLVIGPSIVGDCTSKVKTSASEILEQWKKMKLQK